MPFTAARYLCTFHALVLQAGDPSLGFIAHTFQSNPSGHLNNPLVLQLLPVGSQPVLSCLYHTLYHSYCAEADSFV